jgi:mannose-6-phosphate isomerase
MPQLDKLTPTVLEKVWGSALTQPWLDNPERKKIGEMWFSAQPDLPVLVKFLFTSERLSVQVHPDDAYARAHNNCTGKTEMWHILRAEPGAAVALGLREATSKERLRAAALSGEIVEMLNWIPAHPGDTFFVPAGTIHAIGAGLVLCEIQQFSDVTYRLFDYHRQPERELHLDDSLAVANLEPTFRRKVELPVECEYFRTESLSIRGTAQIPETAQTAMYVAMAGEGEINGEPFRPGEAWLASPGAPPFEIKSSPAEFVIARA